MPHSAVRYYRHEVSTSTQKHAGSEATTETLESRFRTAAVIVTFFFYYLVTSGDERRNRENARA
jgi:hypothetical protein